jgi:hypothetical protein
MKRTAPLAVAALALALSATCCVCRGTNPAPGAVGQAPAPRPTSDDAPARVWFDPTVDFTSYSRLLVDPVDVALVPGAEAASLDPAVLAGLALEFRATLVRVVDPYYDVLDAPAPRTIRVHVALTDARMRPGGASAADLAAIRAEWEAFDATTGKRIAVGARWRESREDAPGFEASALALLDLMNSRQDLGAGGPKR